MKKTLIISCLFAFSITGCQDDFLQRVPETSLSSATFFKTEADFQQAVNGAYVPLRTIINDRAWLLGEMHSDNTYFARNILYGATEQYEDIADFAIPSSNGVTANEHIREQYRLNYQIIARANQILALIDDVDFDQAAKDNIKGQSLFLRAYAYFDLVQYFGSVPMHLVPVEERAEAAQSLASEEELYQQILADVTTAVGLLPAKSNQEAGRITSGAANTLLANVHIVRENWAEAEAPLREVINSGEYALISDFGEVFSNSTGNKNNIESVFEVQFLEGSAGLNGNFLYQFMPRPINPEELVTITGTANPQGLNGEGNNIPTPDIIEAFEEGDLRKDVSIGYITLEGSFWSDGNYPYIKKFAKTHSLHDNHGMNWPIYRYSEVLLFMAEVLNEQGRDGEAAQFLNMVRTRAGLPDATGNLEEAIFQERHVELAFENKRWHDLVRTGRAMDVITAHGNRIKANPQDYYYPEGALPRSHAFSSINLHYALPADEAALSPYF